MILNDWSDCYATVFVNGGFQPVHVVHPVRKQRSLPRKWRE